MNVLHQFKLICEYLQGCGEEPPPALKFMSSPVWQGIWWGLLAGAILLFCGQTSKFIYIDF
jgi:hypothetical protein